VAGNADGGDKGNRPLAAKQDEAARTEFDATDATAKSPVHTMDGDSEVDMKNTTGTTLTAEVVHLTANLRTLAALEEVVDGIPVVDVSKVERIRFALETGAYRISPRRIADKLVDGEREEN